MPRFEGGTNPLKEEFRTDVGKVSDTDLEGQYDRFFEACGDGRSLKRSGIKRLLPHVSEVLADREEIVAMTSGVSKQGWCLIVLTGKRVLFLRKGLLSGLQHVTVEVEKISSTSGKIGVTMGVLWITAGPETWKIERIPKRAVMPFTHKVEDVMRRRVSGTEG